MQCIWASKLTFIRIYLWSPQEAPPTQPFLGKILKAVRQNLQTLHIVLSIGLLQKIAVLYHLNLRRFKKSNEEKHVLQLVNISTQAVSRRYYRVWSGLLQSPAEEQRLVLFYSIVNKISCIFRLAAFWHPLTVEQKIITELNFMFELNVSHLNIHFSQQQF